MKKNQRKNAITKIRELAEDGLCTDGSHHKQWYLEEIFKLAGGEIDNEMAMSIEEGIAP